MPVVGTAGHVDHGKTLLITALTGVDTDRLPEEKRRGMTIDLGFTHFLDPHGQPIGVIDVPGHERYIRNMVAGAWGVDCALLVVAADDGWMPQTETHARVLSVFGVDRIILVLNKIDLVSRERLDAVEEDAGLRAGDLFGRPLPVVRVSARTGEGVEALKAAIVRELEWLRDSRNRKELPFKSVHRLYIDRVFSLKGAGTIVAGSLRRGRIRVNDELLLLPRGERVRVRRIQSYTQDHDQVVADDTTGSIRVALNLHGLSSTPARGDCLLTGPGDSAGRDGAHRESLGEVQREFLAVGYLQSSLRARQEAEIAFGTTHQKLTVYRLRSSNGSSSNESAKDDPHEGGEPLRLVLERASCLVPGDRFLLIRPGGSDLLGWGEVLWGGETTAGERRKVGSLFRAEGRIPTPLEVEAILKGFATFEREGAQEGMGRIGKGSSDSSPLRRVGNYLFETGFLERSRGRIRAAIQRFREPSIPEVAKNVSLPEEVVRGIFLDLKSEAGLLSPGELRVVDALLEGPQGQGDRRRSEQKAEPSIDITSLPKQTQRLYQEISEKGETPWELQPGRGSLVREDLDRLCKAGSIIPLDTTLYLERRAYYSLVRRVLAGRAEGDRITIGEAKQATGFSRKYILPFLNRMERDGWVKRWGDDRVIRRTWPVREQTETRG
ncbi:MAG: selenocysteine-specific translation elongation factor [Spirochaetales bacterium]